MARKVGFDALKGAAVVIAAAALFYKLLRILSIDGVTNITNSFTDKIANMFIPGSTKERIYTAALQRLKLKFKAPNQAEILAELMVEQSQYETANYTSNVLRNNLNAFGYKYFPKSKYQLGEGTVSPELNSYAKYADVADSAREVADWLGRRVKDFEAVKTEKEYAALLKKNDYFGQSASAYASGLSYYEKTLYA